MLNDYRHMMFDYFIKRTRKIYKERKEKLQKIKNRQDAEIYKKEVKEKIKKSFFPLPEKTPLNSRITGEVKRDKYRIEKIIFESRPECFVTANLYIPEKIEPPYPAIVASCGHSAEGKAEPMYQEFSQRLVNNGFLVLIYDPFNQGERDQYYYLPKKSGLRRSCTFAHNMMGKQLNLIDEFFGSWRVWDGIRAIDYITTTTQWDKNFIGMTGNSGGGTLTTWIWACEERLKGAAPSCFITPFLYNLENEYPQDREQYPPGVLGREIELADFFISRAPEPVILLGQKYDAFDIRGFEEICNEVKWFYSLLGKEDNFQYFIGNNPHGYYPDAQKEMVKFFCKIANKEVIDLEPEIKIEEPEILFATKKGNVIAEGSKPIYVMIGEKAEAIIKERKKLDEKELKEEIRKLFKIPESIEIPHYRILRPIEEEGKVIGRYAVETEENIWVILKKRMVEAEKVFYLSAEKEINLFLPNLSSEDDIKKQKETPAYFIDVRGIGESMPCLKKDFYHPYGYDYMFDGFYILFEESYLGKRIYDVLCVIKLLNSKGCEIINLYGDGIGSIISLFVSLFSNSIKKLTLKNLPDSYFSLTKIPSVKIPCSSMPKGILKITDIPEIIEFLKKNVEICLLK
ncbi:MAG: acetylxylan esterase [Candidatus Omnitrophica bacterium]|nr:acetylxylan esterase [Candidatus Omnitrophota bacterium]